MRCGNSLLVELLQALGRYVEQRDVLAGGTALVLGP